MRVSLFIYVCYGHVQHKQLTIAYFACVLKQIFAYIGCVLKQIFAYIGCVLKQIFAYFGCVLKQIAAKIFA